MRTWCEKDALTGVIQPICEEYGVPYVATRGFPSLTLVYESAEVMKARGRPTRVHYYGDQDASGRTISDRLEADLRAHGADVRVTRMALNPDQIERWDLPTRPGKRTDSRHRAFSATYGDRCVELDALPPEDLEDLIRVSIVGEIDADAWRRAEAVEAAERATFESIAAIRFTPGERYTLPER